LELQPFHMQILANIIIVVNVTGKYQLKNGAMVM